jgi:hypothetical protein
VQQAPADLAAAVPDVSSMSEVQLEAFLRTVSIQLLPLSSASGCGVAQTVWEFVVVDMEVPAAAEQP